MPTYFGGFLLENEEENEDSVGINNEATPTPAPAPAADIGELNDEPEKSGGDGQEAPVTPPLTDEFEVDGNKMSVEFWRFHYHGDIDTIPLLDDLKKKMNKIGMDLNYKVEVLKTELRPTKKSSEKQPSDLYKITVEYTAPNFRVRGYEYVMSLEHTNGGNFVFPAAAHKGDDFTKYYTGTFVCDHCKVDRLRNDMHVFRKDADGKEYVYGTTCAKKYFGIDFLGKIKTIIRKLYDIFAAFGNSGDDDDGEYSGGGRGGNPTVQSFFTYAWMVIDDKPVWIKGGENGGGTTTAVEMLYNKKPSERESWMSELTGKYYGDTPESYQAFRDKMGVEYKNFIEFYENMQPRNEFQQNLKTTALSQSNRNYRPGLLVYSIYYWYKAVHTDASKGEETAKKTTPSTYVGNEGDKLVFGNVQVLKTIPFESQYGGGLMYLIASKGEMTDEATFKAMVKKKESISTADAGKNDLLVWYTSSNADMEEGKSYVIKATVSKHKEYFNRNNSDAAPIKQTVVKLVKKISDIS